MFEILRKSEIHYDINSKIIRCKHYVGEASLKAMKKGTIACVEVDLTSSCSCKQFFPLSSSLRIGAVLWFDSGQTGKK